MNKYKNKELKLKSGRKVTLRLPTMDDAKTFTTFINDLVKEEAFEYSGLQTLQDEVGYIEFLLGEVSNGTGVHIIADYEGEKVAGADLTNSGYKKEHVLELQIYVRKDFRGEGLGTLLVRELEAEARKLNGIRTIFLTSFANNTGAMKLYQKLGYKECGQLPKVLKHKGKFVDEMYMYKHLAT